MFIDAHAHVDKYGDIVNEALQQIQQHRIFTIATAMDVPSYSELQTIGDRSNLILPTFGIHPRRAPEYVDRLSELSPFIEQSPAIGEIGLDFHWVKDSSTYPAQLKVLEYFLAAAREQKKFVNLHTKGAEQEILKLLERYDIERAIVHWYSGPLDILRELIDFGAYFTVGVEISFSETIKAIARAIPDHLLLTETDNPGGLKWLKGVIGMPKEVEKVIEVTAGLRGVSSAALTQTIHDNFMRLIDSDPWLKEAHAILSQPKC
jgi:TatD DNase family protein